MPLPALFALAGAFLSEMQNSSSNYPHPARWGLSDPQLWQKVITGQDPMAGMSMKQAVKLDPRRIDAKIRQCYYIPMHRGIPSDPMSRQYDEALYLMGMNLINNNVGPGAVQTLPLISLHEESWYRILQGTAKTWPPQLRRMLLSRWPEISEGFSCAQDVAAQARAAAVSLNMTREAQEWQAMIGVLGQMRDALHETLQTGAVPQLPEHVEARPMLTGPSAPALAGRDEYGRLYARGFRHAPVDGFPGSASTGYRGSRLPW